MFSLIDPHSVSLEGSSSGQRLGKSQLECSSGAPGGSVSGSSLVRVWFVSGCVAWAFGTTPVEDRGFRPSGCRFRGSFGVTPVEDRGFRLRRCLPSVASEAFLERPLSRIVAFDPRYVASEVYLE